MLDHEKYTPENKVHFEGEVGALVATRYTALVSGTYHSEEAIKGLYPNEEEITFGEGKTFTARRVFGEAAPLLTWFRNPLGDIGGTVTKYVVFDRLRDAHQGTMHSATTFVRSDFDAWLNEATVATAAYDAFKRAARQEDLDRNAPRPTAVKEAEKGAAATTVPIAKRFHHPDGSTRDVSTPEEEQAAIADGFVDIHDMSVV
jgi:hypothetical protein